MLPTVHCLVPSHSQAESILAQLEQAGIRRSDIAYVRYGSQSESFRNPGRVIESNTDSPAEKARGGATAGAIAGAAAGLGFMGIVGLTPLLVIAPVVITLGAAIGAGFGTLAALTALGGYGVPQEEQTAYENALRAGGALVAVNTEDERELDQAAKIMQAAGARARVIRFTKRLS